MHFKNAYRSRIVAGLLAAGALLPSAFCRAHSLKKTPDSGITDDRVRAMGENAEGFLAAKLADPKEERHYEGIVRQFERIMRADRENPKATEGLINFVEKQKRRDLIPPSVLYAMEGAILVLGVRGGNEGIKYLESWFEIEPTVTARIPNGDAALTKNHLKRAAIRALGLSGRDDVAERLERLRGELPAGEESAAYLRDIGEARKDHDDVKQKGLEKALKERGLR